MPPNFDKKNGLESDRGDGPTELALAPSFRWRRGNVGGDKGGRVIATGTPEDVAAVKSSFTGQYLKPYLREKAKLAARKLVKKKAKATKPRARKRATA